MSARHVAAPHLVPRAVAATVLVMGGTTLAHTWAGGHLPGAPALVGLAAVVFAGGLLALGGVVRMPVLLVAVLAAQAGLHGMFGLLETSAHAGHATIGAAATTTSVTLPTTADLVGWQMLAAHAVSTLLTALVWELCSRAASVVLAALLVWRELVPGTPARRPVLRELPAPAALLGLVSAPRRGPPMALPLA